MLCLPCDRKEKQTYENKLRCLSPRMNYTDRATAACWWSQYQLLADRGVSRSQRDRSLQPYCRLSRPEPLLFPSNSSTVVLTWLSGLRSTPTTSQKIWYRWQSKPDLWICRQELWPLDHRGGLLSSTSIYIYKNVTCLWPLQGSDIVSRKVRHRLHCNLDTT
jgi:hypothetical protein